MKLLDDFNKAKKEIYDYFGYEEDWKVFPIDDNRSLYWYIDGGTVMMFADMEAFEKEDEERMYSGFLHRDKIYEKPDFTMVIMDTQSDGNIFLSIFDNSKKLTPEQ